MARLQPDTLLVCWSSGWLLQKNPHDIKVDHIEISELSKMLWGEYNRDSKASTRTYFYILVIRMQSFNGGEWGVKSLVDWAHHLLKSLDKTHSSFGYTFDDDLATLGIKTSQNEPWWSFFYQWCWLGPTQVSWRTKHMLLHVQKVFWDFWWISKGIIDTKIMAFWAQDYFFTKRLWD
jgi:hypothetical protein